MRQLVLIVLLFLFGCSSATHEHDSLCSAKCSNCADVELTCEIKNSKKKIEVKTSNLN